MATKYFTSFDSYAFDLVEYAVRWMDRHWDESAGMLGIKPYENLSSLPLVHHIRETCWYALGLLQRNANDDRQRACHALQVILRYQFDEPEAAYDGTWYRFPEEPHPGTMPIWEGYDPNWREFIGTTLAIILLDFEQDLPMELVRTIDDALRKTIRGALARNLSASYTNIALMHAFLLLFAGKRFGKPGWIDTGEQFAREIYHLFAPNRTFSEFNSPTYYGVDLYALGLWRTYSSSSLLQQLGAEMEAALWRDIALTYHAGMKNLAGPFDRSYGMDMQHYATTIGMWIWMVVGREAAPFPDVAQPFAHSHDFGFAPCFVAVGINVSEETRQHLQGFQGEHQVKRIIANEPRRVATSWIGKNILLGGEYTSYSEPASNQFHPATIHWNSVHNRINWIKLLYTTPVNAHATKDNVSISSIAQGEDTPDFFFQICAPVKAKGRIQHDFWQLCGLTVHIETNAHFVQTREKGDYHEVCYSAKDLAPNTTIQFLLTTRIEREV